MNSEPRRSTVAHGSTCPAGKRPPLRGTVRVSGRRSGAWPSRWRRGRLDVAHWLSSRAWAGLGVDIHPAVPIGKGVMLDHATGIVIGETAVVEDDVSILQDVTLGATGKERGDRHPKVRRGAMLG